MTNIKPLLLKLDLVKKGTQENYDRFLDEMNQIHDIIENDKEGFEKELTEVLSKDKALFDHLQVINDNFFSYIEILHDLLMSTRNKDLAHYIVETTEKTCYAKNTLHKIILDIDPNAEV